MMNIPRVTSFRGSDMMRIASRSDRAQYHSPLTIISYYDWLDRSFPAHGPHPTFPNKLRVQVRPPLSPVDSKKSS